jgi:hypothetical protein
MLHNLFLVSRNMHAKFVYLKIGVSDLSLSSGEGSSCISETKHNRRTVWRPKLFVLKRRYRNKGQNPKNLSCLRVLVKMVYVTWKLSTIEKRCQGQSCLFRRVDYRNKGHNPEKLSSIRVPVKMVSVAQKLSMIEEQCQNQHCFSNRNTGYNPENYSGFKSQWRWFP